MACIYLLNSREGPRSLDFVITTYTKGSYQGDKNWIKVCQFEWGGGALTPFAHCQGGSR